MTTILVKVTWTHTDSEEEGIRYFTKEEWQHRVDHTNSFEFNDEDITSEEGISYYYEDNDNLLNSFTVEEVTERGEKQGDFVDPLNVDPYVPEDEDYW